MFELPESDRIKTNSREHYFLTGFICSYLNFKRGLPTPTKRYKTKWRKEQYRRGVELGWASVSGYYKEVLNQKRPKVQHAENLEEFLQEIDKIFEWVMRDEWPDEPPSLETADFMGGVRLDKSTRGFFYDTTNLGYLCNL